MIKVFNNITAWHLASLARPAGAPDRSALPIAGDDQVAKGAVTRFLDAIGREGCRPRSRGAARAGGC